MARKVFQDFANVMCQRFIELPSNRDLVNLVILGGGTLVLDVMAAKATCNRYPVTPLPYSENARSWLDAQMKQRSIPDIELVGASLTVIYAVELSREPGDPIPVATFDFSCTASIVSPDRTYNSEMKAQKRWGLATV